MSVWLSIHQKLDSSSCRSFFSSSASVIHRVLSAPGNTPTCRPSFDNPGTHFLKKSGSEILFGVKPSAPLAYSTANSELGQTGKCATPSSSDTMDRKQLSELTSIQISRSSNTSLRK